MQMSQVKECEVERCAYNRGRKCHALAITIGDMTHPHCDTFCGGSASGGDDGSTAGVGACKTGDCQFNRSLECTASSIRVSWCGDEADCVTFRKR